MAKIKLLERRLNAGPGAEKKKPKAIQLLASLAFIGVMILPSLDHRLSWSTVRALRDRGDVLVAFGFLIVFLVFKENTFTAATLKWPLAKSYFNGPYAMFVILCMQGRWSCCSARLSRSDRGGISLCSFR
jgi:hypothetical protein